MRAQGLSILFFMEGFNKMLILETIIGYGCFLVVNVIYDTYIRKLKSPFVSLAIVSLIQTIIALGIYFVF